MINKTTTVQNCSNAAQANSSPFFSNPLAPNICYYQASCTAESLHSIPNRPVNNDFHCNTDILKAQYMRINLPNTCSHWKEMNLTGHIYCLNTKQCKRNTNSNLQAHTITRTKHPILH